MDLRTNKRKLNNAGFTLVELMVTFALLGIFMVAAARVISYTISIYYVAKGNSYGYQVSYMIANKITGQIENASTVNSFKIDGKGDDASFVNPTVYNGGDNIKFVDSTGSIVTIGLENDYFLMTYDEVKGFMDDKSDYYKEVNWTFDPKAYMGYVITDMKFCDPGILYPDNVIRLDMTVHSSKYGDFDTQYFIKCNNVEEIDYL